MAAKTRRGHVRVWYREACGLWLASFSPADLDSGVSDRRREYVVADLEAVVAAEELQNIRGETRHRPSAALGSVPGPVG